MGVRIYHDEKYFYATFIDDEGNEYMTYGEYLLIRDRVPGFAVFFESPPVVKNGVPVRFETKFTKAEKVEKLNDKLFVIYAGQDVFITSGDMSSWASPDAVKFLKETFDVKKLELLANYDFTNASYIFRYGNKFIVVYDNLYLRVDPVTLGINNDAKRRHVIRVIDFDTNPTTEKIYQIEDGVVEFLGRRYVDHVPIYGCACGKNHVRIESPISHDRIIVRQGERIRVVMRGGGNYVRVMKHAAGGASEDMLPHRFREFYRKYNPVRKTVVAVFEYGGKIYFGDVPLNAYVVGNRDYIVENFARELPVRAVGEKLFLDWSRFKKCKNKKTEKHYRLFGVDFVDRDYALVGRVGSEAIVLPLVESDPLSGKRTFVMSADVYRKIKGDPNAGRLDSFYVYKYEVNYSTLSAPYGEKKVWGSKIMKFRGYCLPDEKNVRSVVERIGDFVKGVYYVPGRDDYAIVFEVDEGFVVLRRWNNALFVPRGLEIGFELDSDCTGVVGFSPEVNIDGSYAFGRGGNGSKNYFEIIIHGGRAEVKYIGGRWKRTGDLKIFFPIKRPAYIYKNCGIYLGIGNRPVVFIRRLYLPSGVAVKRITTADDCMTITLGIQKTGDVLDVVLCDDGEVLIESDGRIIAELKNEEELYPFLEVASRVGLRTACLMV